MAFICNQSHLRSKKLKKILYLILQYPQKFFGFLSELRSSPIPSGKLCYWPLRKKKKISGFYTNVASHCSVFDVNEGKQKNLRLLVDAVRGQLVHTKFQSSKLKDAEDIGWLISSAQTNFEGTEVYIDSRK